MSEELKQTLLESKKGRMYSIYDYYYSKLVDKCIGKNNINVQDHEGDSLLMYAILLFNDSTSLIMLLLENGAKVNTQNNEGMTALMKAAMLNRISIVELLLKYGANPNLEDNFGCTAKYLTDSDEIVKMLENAEQNYTEESNIESNDVHELGEDIRRVLKL